MNKVKLAPNVAVKVSAKYIDLFPGDHGPSVRLKGKFDGGDGVLYLPGNAEDSLATLTAAGIIPPYTDSMEPAEAVNLKPKRKEFELVLEQQAGEKYGRVVVVGAAAPSAAGSPNGNGQHAPANGVASVRARNQKPVAVLYDQCLQFAAKHVPERLKAIGLTATSADVMAGAATLFIQAAKADGPIFSAPKPVPAPAPVPPPPPPPRPAPQPAAVPAGAGAPSRFTGEFDDFPAALEDTDDDLPF